MLKQLQPLKITEGVKDDELTPEGAMSINYAATAHTLYGFLLKASTSQSPVEMLELIAKDLSSTTPEAAIPAMESLSNAEQLQTLISKLTDPKDFMLTLNICCLTINKSIKELLQEAVQRVNLRTELDSELAKSAANLQSMMVRELCACYGDQIYIMMDLKNKVAGNKPDDIDEAEWNKMKNKYEQAVKTHAMLDEIIYHAFINISEHLKFQMNQLS